MLCYHTPQEYAGMCRMELEQWCGHARHKRSYYVSAFLGFVLWEHGSLSMLGQT